MNAPRWAVFNCFEFRLPQAAIDAICVSGANDAAVAEAVKNPEVKAELDKLAPEDIADELRGYGAWDENELADYTQNRHRIVWCAAWNIFDEPHEAQS